MTTSLMQPFPIFTDANGDPIDAGFVYVGTANMDPIAHPIDVFWDAALSIDAPNPLRTIGGFLSRDGAPANAYVDSDFSIAVHDRNNVLVFSSSTNPFRVGSTGGWTIQDGEEGVVESGGAIVVEDGALLNIGTGGGAATVVNVQSNARWIGDITPDADDDGALGTLLRRWKAFLSEVRVSLSLRPQVAGGAVVGSDALPFSDVVARALSVKTTLRSFLSTQPASTTDQLRMNQRNLCLLCGYFDGTGSGAGTFRNEYNVTNKARNGVGDYTVTPAVALPQDCPIVGTLSQSSGGGQIIVSVNAAGTAISVATLSGAGAVADLSFSLVAMGMPRGGPIADPIS